MSHPTAEAHVSEFFELQGLAPPLEVWRPRDAFLANPPRRIRLLRLRAMALALGLRWDPVGFPGGTAVDTTDLRHRARLDEIEGLLRGGRGVELAQLDTYFEVLFAYRTRLDACLRFSGGVLETSGLQLAAHVQIGGWNGDLAPIAARVDRLLGSLLDPGGRTFSEFELVHDHGFPPESVLDVDIEWM